jgi:hypothetical protein
MPVPLMPPPITARSKSATDSPLAPSLANPSVSLPLS